MQILLELLAGVAEAEAEAEVVAAPKGTRALRRSALLAILVLVVVVV